MRNRTRGVDLARSADVADTRWGRLRGLLGRGPLRPGEGLVLSPSRGVHMWGMRYPIDVVLADDRGRVVALYPGLRPWSRTGIHADAEHAVELPEGSIDRTGTRRGDSLEIVSRETGEGAVLRHGEES